MLLELRVQNLLLIDSAELVLDPALNVVTGETGAGKTVLAHSLDLLLGGRPRPNVVRPGADEAYVEGVFAAPPRLADDPELAPLAERLPLDGEEIVLARRVTAQGRTRAYLQGRSASAHELRAVGSRLVAFFGQHEHRKLMLASSQLEILDAFCGASQLDRRTAFERVLGSARRTERELAELRERAGLRERDLDLLDYEIQEIDRAAPSEAEEEALEQERGRLGAVEALREAAGRAAAAIDSEADERGPEASGALAAASVARSELARMEGRDAALDALAERSESLLYELQDLGGALNDYLSSLEADPARLAEVEERLDLFGRLKRKHGGSIAAVLEHAEHCRAERERLANLEEATEALEAQLGRASTDVERLAGELSAERRRAAPKLARAVRAELRELAMEEAGFEVRIEPRSVEAEGDPLERFASSGADAVEFFIATNAGVPAGPLREVASGGELSRIMLALMTVATLAKSRAAAAVVFDEVDAGVGGATGRAVGEKLRSLSAHRQVVCITHLPQVASLAARHFRVVKDPGSGSGRGGSVARAAVERLERRELVAELCRMLGADSGDLAARRHAEQLLEAA